MKQIEILEIEQNSGVVLNRFNQTLSVHPAAHPEKVLVHIPEYLVYLMRHPSHKHSVIQISWSDNVPPKQLPLGLF